MRFFIDLAPWAAFAIAFWITRDLHFATIVLIPATVAQVVVMRVIYGRFEKLHLVTLGAVVVFGGATIVFQESRFIQWKPTVVNGLLALIFAASLVYGERKPLPQHLLGDKLSLPNKVWQTLTLLWIGFFVFSGVVNIFVAYLMSEQSWVNFKLFGQMAITLVFVVGQSLYLAQYFPKNQQNI